MDAHGEVRRFTLVDAMALIAATAAGLTIFRGNPMAVFVHLPDTWSLKAGLERVVYWVAAAVPCIVMWMLALLILRLRRPRPRLRCVARQPGAVACLAAVMVVAVGSATATPARITSAIQQDGWRDFQLHWSIYLTFINLQTCVSYAVAASWSTLALGGFWRPERSWIDRAGRVLGVFWVGVIPLYPWIMIVI